jgi:GTP pyrophosphokinase
MDRLHNMSTIEHVPPEKRKRIALETLDIYAPIADRLGMGKIQRELEDLAFPYVDHDAFTHTSDIRKAAAKQAEKGLATVKKRLARALADRGLHSFETSIRIKGLWSLYKKLERKEKDITKIYDIAALRVIVDTIDDCYTTLGVVHSLWKPIPGKFKDYIAFEKPNGYRSLHTTVLTPDAGVVEIQIRTKEMHAHAQYGIASHMSYKTLGNAPRRVFDSISAVWLSLIPGLLRHTTTAEKEGGALAPPPKWLGDLAASHEEVFESTKYLENLKEDFFSHRVFVFTPQGDVIDLPIHSSPIDFAYAIHSDIGNRVSGAKVNGKLVSFDTRLSNGDVVEIITKKTARPTAKWLDFVKTSLARRHIRTEIEQQGDKWKM